MSVNNGSSIYNFGINEEDIERDISQLAYYEKPGIDNLDWRNARVNAGTGVIIETSDRVSTFPKIFVHKDTKIKFPTEDTSLEWTVLGFSESDYTLSQVDISKHLYGGASWSSSEFFTAPMDSYIIIQCRYNDNSNISINDEILNSIEIEFEKDFSTEYLKAKLEKIPLNEVDLFIFAGQSNMAGRGATSAEHPEQAPKIINGAGYEFRAISDPSKLYPIEEPFGVNENKTGGISEPGAKTGSMVTSFVNAYYSAIKTTVIGVSASKGGSKISEWKSNGVLLPDAIQRYIDAVTFLTDKGYKIRHKYVLWCQGESDGDNLTNVSDYTSDFIDVANSFFNIGIEKFFVVRIGRINSGDNTRYDYIIDAQTSICKQTKNIVMASTDFYSMQSRGLMRDAYHYYQEGYNEVGTYSGQNVAEFVITSGKNPVMYDPKSGALYYSEKN